VNGRAEHQDPAKGEAIPVEAARFTRWTRVRVRLEPRPGVGLLWQGAVAVSSLLLGMGGGAVVLVLTGVDPIRTYTQVVLDTFGGVYAFSETLVKATPLLLAALGVMLAFRMQLWNIGAEGQFYMGAFLASAIAYAWPDWPPVLLLAAMVLAGMAGGALWAFLPALWRAFLSVNEIITTLMLNYIAILWVDYLVYGPWKDPKGFGFPLTAPFGPNAQLPQFFGTRVHLGLALGLVAAGAVWLILKRSRWGYEIRVIGENSRAARYAGMGIGTNIVAVMLLSGALAGMAGMAEVAGVNHRLQHGLSPGYGYTAIIVAWLSRLNPFAGIAVSVLLGALLAGGYSMQRMGMPIATVNMIQGLILFFVLGGELVARYRVRLMRVGVN
jgi:ABC-type uncharacterized transport system permease subunit